MRKVEIVKPREVQIKPFVLEAFIEYKNAVYPQEGISKKTLKELAERLGLMYSKEALDLAQKLLEVYIKEKR
ncbi:MAG: hypothetical protein IE885_06470 [Campylobacterales bacterium]|nr:hypothetical protein [Campylobacterales bacterium]